jgi:hypothetical protein
MNTKIFISHKKEDSDKAESVAEYIKKYYEFEVYVDTLDDGITNIINITDRIVDKLRDSTHLLVIFSEKTKGSMWVPFELGVSFEREQGIGVLIWSDNTSITYNLPEYLDEFPKLQCYKKEKKDNCNPKDLNKYLDEIKKNPTKDILMDSISLEEFNFTKTASEVNYAREFINRLNRVL